MLRSWLIVLCLATVAAGSAVATCSGDLDGDGAVTVDEVLRLVNTGLSGCDTNCPGDTNGDSTVTVDEILTAVDRALDGCAPTTTPEPVATPTPVPTECLTFHLARCCDDEAGTRGCGSAPCRSDDECAKGKVCSGNNSDDGIIGWTAYKWSPTCEKTSDIQLSVAAYAPDEVDELFVGTNGLIRWNTASLAGRKVVAANWYPYIRYVIDDDHRDFVGEAHPFAVPYSCRDYTVNVGDSAFRIAMSALVKESLNAPIPLAPAAINTQGYTSLRLGISGGAPEEENQVEILDSSKVYQSDSAAWLEVCVLVEPTPAAK